VTSAARPLPLPGFRGGCGRVVALWSCRTRVARTDPTEAEGG